MVQLRKLQLQHAADAAALGAMYESARGDADWLSAGQADAALNGFTNGSNGVTVNIANPPTSGSYNGDSSAFQATVTQNYHTAFLQMFGRFGAMSPGVSAVAKKTPNPNCVYVFDNGSLLQYAVALSPLAGLTADCGVYIYGTSNSINVTSSSLTVNGNNNLNVSGASNTVFNLFGGISPSPTFNAPTETDPLAGETSPAFSSCNHTGATYNLQPSVTLSPGTYCQGLNIWGSNVTFQPGLYIITGGGTWLSSTVTGTGVTIFLTKGGGSNSYTNLAINGTSVTFTAPTSTANGGLTGIVFFADRNWNSSTQGITLTSCTVTTDGIWYLLNTEISLSFAAIQTNNYLGLVVADLSLSNSSITVPSPDYSSLSGGSPYSGGSGGVVE